MDFSADQKTNNRVKRTLTGTAVAGLAIFAGWRGVTSFHAERDAINNTKLFLNSIRLGKTYDHEEVTLAGTLVFYGGTTGKDFAIHNAYFYIDPKTFGSESPSQLRVIIHYDHYQPFVRNQEFDAIVCGTIKPTSRTKSNETSYEIEVGGSNTRGYISQMRIFRSPGNPSSR